MRSSFRVGALILALLGGAGLAPAQEVAADQISPQPAEDVTTGSIDRSARPESLRLSDEQRGFIFLGVISLPDVPEVDLSVAELAAPLPSEVELQDLPATVTRGIPLLQDYKFVKLDDRILLIRPTDRVVVGEIPRYRLVQ
jgi:hypothetical protein